MFLPRFSGFIKGCIQLSGAWTHNSFLQVRTKNDPIEILWTTQEISIRSNSVTKGLQTLNNPYLIYEIYETCFNVSPKTPPLAVLLRISRSPTPMLPSVGQSVSEAASGLHQLVTTLASPVKSSSYSPRNIIDHKFNKMFWSKWSWIYC